MENGDFLGPEGKSPKKSSFSNKSIQFLQYLNGDFLGPEGKSPKKSSFSRKLQNFYNNCMGTFWDLKEKTRKSPQIHANSTFFTIFQDGDFLGPNSKVHIFSYFSNESHKTSAKYSKKLWNFIKYSALARFFKTSQFERT
jgi:hypothetical protein